LHYICLGRFTKERNKEEIGDKKIRYFYGLDKKRNKLEREKYNNLWKITKLGTKYAVIIDDQNMRLSKIRNKKCN
jgi:hypothetical protein